MYLVKIHYFQVSEKRSCNLMQSIARGLLPLFDKAAKKASFKKDVGLELVSTIHNHFTPENSRQVHLKITRLKSGKSSEFQPSSVGFQMLIFQGVLSHIILVVPWLP